MKCLKNTILTFFILSLFPIYAFADKTAPVDLNKYSVMLCGKVPNGVLSDIDSPEKIFSPSGVVDLMILISNEDPDAISYGRVVSDGRIFFKGGNLVKFDALFIMTVDNEMHTDTVTYISKNNKVTGGLFYKRISDTVKPEEVYISKSGNVYHVKIEKINDRDCIDRFK